MSIDDELASFFNEVPEQVISDSKQFRLKLGIGMDAYKTLSKICDIAPLLSGGAIGTSAGLVGLQGSAGLLGFIGLGSTPIGWIALAGVVGASAFYGGSQLLKKAKQGAVQEIPKYINSPIDVIASSILYFIAPIVFKLAKLDGQVSEKEKMFILQHFVDEWGFDRIYIEAQIPSIIEASESINFDKISLKINELVKTGDVNKEQLIHHVVELSEALCQIDQAEHHETQIQINALKKALMYGESEWQVIAGQYAENLKEHTQQAATVTLTKMSNMGSMLVDKSKQVIDKSAALSKEGSERLAPKVDELKKKSSFLLDGTKGLFNKNNTK